MRIPICILCITSQRHKTHDVVHLQDIYEVQKDKLNRNLQELRFSIYPKYQKYASEISKQKANIEKNTNKLNALLTEHGKVWHKEIDKTINKIKSEIGKINLKSLNALKEQEGTIRECISEITRKITNLKTLFDSNDVNRISSYKSRVRKYRRLPPKETISLPRFTPQTINKKQLYEQFGFLSSSLNKTEEEIDELYHSETDFSPKRKRLADESRMIKSLETKQKEYKRILNLSCSRDDEIWTCAQDNVMKLFCFQVDIVKSVKTRTGNIPFDITVTRSGNLVYTDDFDKTVNIVKDTQIHTLIKLKDWIPLNVCSTFSGDLLVFMNRHDDKQTKLIVGQL